MRKQMSKQKKYATALIDVGIDSHSLGKYANSTHFYRVNGESLLDLGEEDVLHNISHGGQCLEYFAAGAQKPVDCFIHLKQDAYGRCNVDDLITAFEWCIENNVSLISLSMGTVQYGDAKKLSNITKRISKQGICMVVSASNDRLLSYPACLKDCIGVCTDYNLSLGLSKFAYISNPFDGIDVVLNPYTQEGDCLGSNSMSTAYFAGFLMKSLTEAGCDYNAARDWLAANSEPFIPSALYSYSFNAIRVRYENDPIAIAVQDLCEPQTEELCRELQNLFHESEYYCLTVYPKDCREESHLIEGCSTDKTDFALYTHQYPCDFGCTYEEYVKLIIQLCRPNVIIVDYDSFNEYNMADVMLCNSDVPAVAENILVINVISRSPGEIFDMVIDYFG
jgi:hypothetical protein